MTIQQISSRLLPVFLTFFWGTCLPASAQTDVITDAGDESTGSLGWAVTTLNNTGAGAISIENVGPITLTQPLPSVSQNVTFQGTGAQVIGQEDSQAQFLFEQGFTLDVSASLTFTNNGALSSGLDAALTAASFNLSSDSAFSLTGGVSTSGGGGAYVTLGTASAASGATFTIQGGAGSGNGSDGGAAAVSAASISLSGAAGTIAGGEGGSSSSQNGNGGSATLSVGSLSLDTAAQLALTGGNAGTGTGALGNGGGAVLTANSVSLTGTDTQLTLTGGTGGSTSPPGLPGPADAGNGGGILLTTSSVTVDSQALLSVTGGAGGGVYTGSPGQGGTGGSVTVYLGALALTNGGSLGVTAGEGGQGINGQTGGSALVTVGSAFEGTGTNFTVDGGTSGGNNSGGSLNFIATSQTLDSGATFIAAGGAGGSGAVTGGNGGAVQVTSDALTLASGSLWEAVGGAGGTGTSVNGSGSGVNVDIYNLQGSGTVSLGGSGPLTLDLSGGDFSGTVEGVEGLEVSGNVTLTGTNTYSGGTTLLSGALMVNSDSNLGTGNLTFDGGILQVGNYTTSKDISLMANGGIVSEMTPGDQITFNGVLSGPGGLQLTGDGSYIFNAVNTYLGPTTVSSGILNLATGAQIAGPVTLSDLASLNGTGSILGAVTNNGTVQGGTTSSIGTLTVGSYTQTATGLLQTNLSPTQASLLSVSGAATLGGSLSVSQIAGAYNGISYRYTLLSAGSITGTFATENDYLIPTWDSSLVYGSNAVTFALFRTNVDFTPTAVGANETAVAETLNAAVSMGNGSLANKLNELYLAPSSQTLALGQMTGDIYTALPDILIDNQQFEDSLLFDRLTGSTSSPQGGGVGTAIGGAQASLAHDLISAEVSGPAGNAAGLASPNVRGLWVENTDSAGSVNSDGNVEGFNKSNYGFLAGYDAELLPDLTGGLMGGYVHTDVTGTYTGATAGVDSVQFGAYGSRRFDCFEVGGLLGFSLNQFTANRSVSIGSDVTNLSAAFSGSQVQAALQAAYALDVKGFTVKPLAGVQYSQFNEGRFTESGSDSLALAIPAQFFESLRPYLGVEGTQYLKLDQDLGLIPCVDLSASQELMDVASSFQTTLNGDPANPFTVTGITPSATTVGVEVGAQLVFGTQFNLFANYQGHLSGTEDLNTFDGGLDIAF